MAWQDQKENRKINKIIDIKINFFVCFSSVFSSKKKQLSVIYDLGKWILIVKVGFGLITFLFCGL